MNDDAPRRPLLHELACIVAPIIVAEVGCLIRDRYRREHKAAVRARRNHGTGRNEPGGAT